MATPHYGDRRRVLHSSIQSTTSPNAGGGTGSNHSTPTSYKHSPSNNNNKPITARVDLSNFAPSPSTPLRPPHPVRSPTTTSTSSSNQPARPRAHVASSAASILTSSAHTVVSPNSSPSPFPHPSYTRASVSQPSLSPTARQPTSPVARRRSPERERERERERTTPRAPQSTLPPTTIKAKLSSTKLANGTAVGNSSSGSAVAGDRFPATVSYLPSSVSTRNLHSPSSASSSQFPSSSSRSPTLSSSSTTAYTSSSSSPSPLTSPLLGSHFPSSTNHYDSPSLSKSTLTRPPSSTTLNGSSNRPPLSADGLLPPISIARNNSISGASDRSLSPIPLRSPPLVASEHHPSRPVRKNSRPPSAASTRHARSHSTASSSSVTSLFSSVEEAPHRPNHVRAASTAPVFQSLPAVAPMWSPPPNATPTYEELPEIESQTTRRESEEREKDAKVERKIADLEITNASLLSINKSLERLKVQQANEIRDLRRKMRESRPLASIRPVPVREHSVDEYVDEEDEEDEDESTWEELLEQDSHFSAVAGLLESLLKRGRDAIVYQPALAQVGRVLTAVEIEEDTDIESPAADLTALADSSYYYA